MSLKTNSLLLLPDFLISINDAIIQGSFCLYTQASSFKPPLWTPSLSSTFSNRGSLSSQHPFKSFPFSGSLGLSASNRNHHDSSEALRFSSLIRSTVSVHLRRNIGVTAVAFNKELDPVQKLFVDKIREYRTKRQTSGGPVNTGPEYQQDLEKELFKLKQMYGKADMNTFPDSKFEVLDKPQS
ncbi:ATP synthase-coupling factor 6, mitochondrial-like [Vulpes lagopus]|uniref:ATP synthase-coupling factor 6, mitochondrial-like n=1 Tax=Vulpes lagopus TaxID=494514 RepID=UPI001BC92B07|nr:ATP synthase-coupling factor 6, mitochondrial-like [Vulpes lagopus]